MSAKQLTLLDLPIAVANHVQEKLDPGALLACRKVCRSLRTAVDKIGAHFTDLTVSLENRVISIRLDGINLTYSSCLAGSYVADFLHDIFWKETFLKGENYLNIAFNDLKILLKHASCLSIITTLEREKDREYLVRSLVDVLKEEVDIQIETIQLHNHLTIDDILLILPLFNSQTLRSIELGELFPDNEFERITHLDQWKKAKYFNGGDSLFDCSPIEYFLHFEEFRVATSNFPIQNVIKIRDDLLERCTFQECTIAVSRVNWKPVELARIFQPNYAGRDNFTLEYSNGKSKFEINFEDFEFSDMWMLKVKRC